MRLKVELSAAKEYFSLPLAYNHPLASFIYRSLSLASPSYSSFLHQEGYQRFKFFTFSQLLIRERRIRGERLIGRPPLTFLVSSPLAEFLENFVSGLLKQGEIKLCGETFTLSRVEVLPEPEFHEEMTFSCLSPLVISRGVKKEGKLRAEYISFDDPDFPRLMQRNLLRKYSAWKGSDPPDSTFDFKFDLDYVRKRGGEVYRLVDFKGTKIKGIMAPFKVRGSPELIRLGYEAGFGEKNSLGFGMAEAVRQNSKRA